MSDIRDRQRGCLFGLAIGDALGAAVEFQSPGSFFKVEGYRRGGPHNLNAGEWTDDTSMALALADSLGSVGWDLNDQARRYLRWYRTGAYSVNGRCFDIGHTTRTALERFERDGDSRTSGDPSTFASGNGAIMRLAPVPIQFGRDLAANVQHLGMRADESSLPTHPSPQCRSACRYFALLLAGLIEGHDRDEVLSADWSMLRELEQAEPLDPAVQVIAQGSFRRLQPPEIKGSGYVIKSLEAALWAFHRAADFEDAVLLAVNLGDDADTTGAVCGQLAGACWGVGGISEPLLSGLARHDLIEAALTSLGCSNP